MNTEQLDIDYRIVGVRDCPIEKGKVEVFMEPVEELEKEEIENHSPQMAMTQEHMMNPGMFMQFIQDIPQQMGMKPKEEKIPRTIIHLEDAIEFKARGWKHGDVMTVTIRKKEER